MCIPCIRGPTEILWSAVYRMITLKINCTQITDIVKWAQNTRDDPFTWILNSLFQLASFIYLFIILLLYCVFVYFWGYDYTACDEIILSYNDRNMLNAISCNDSWTNKPDLKHKLHMVDMNYFNIWTGTQTGLCDNATN